MEPWTPGRAGGEGSSGLRVSASPGSGTAAHGGPGPSLSPEHGLLPGELRGAAVSPPSHVGWGLTASHTGHGDIPEGTRLRGGRGKAALRTGGKRQLGPNRDPGAPAGTRWDPAGPGGIQRDAVGPGGPWQRCCRGRLARNNTAAPLLSRRRSPFPSAERLCLAFVMERAPPPKSLP